MQLNSLQKNSGTKKGRRIGRGGVRGKTSGRGTKGQKARAGRKLRPEERDILKRIPKRRGHGKNRGRTVNASRVDAVPVSLAALDRAFENGARVTVQALVGASVVRVRAGTKPRIKILATGVLTKKLTIVGCEVSVKAREAILSTGGTVL